MNLQEHVPLAALTTLKIGGPARYFVEARTIAEAQEAAAFSRQQRLPLFVLGGGSNLLVADQGWPGLVVRIAIGGIEERQKNGRRLFEVGAGVDWDSFVAHAVAQNCGGIECMSGIPGSAGGTPVQNVGAYGQEVAETITQVRVLDVEQNAIRDLENAECRFMYRTSVFNTSARGRYIVLRVSYALGPGAAPRLEYADLKKHFSSHRGSPTLAETREAVRQIRLSKGMLIVESDPDCRSAGSFFKNPMVTQEQYREVAARPAARGERVPQFPAPEGKVKLSAAWLVERSGFHKGLSRGRLGISSKHALAIVNKGGARAADVVRFQDEIQQAVAAAFGVELQPEPVFLGFEER